MHKFPIPIAHDIRPVISKWPLRRTAVIVFLGLSLAPLVAEGTSFCYAQWCQVMGRNVQARTPVFDTMYDGLDSGQRSCWHALSSYFQHLPWNPKVVLAIGVILMILAMTMLRL
jgi:hypothetical protein